ISFKMLFISLDISKFNNLPVFMLFLQFWATLCSLCGIYNPLVYCFSCSLIKLLGRTAHSKVIVQFWSPFPLTQSPKQSIYLIALITSSPLVSFTLASKFLYLLVPFVKVVNLGKPFRLFHVFITSSVNFLSRPLLLLLLLIILLLIIVS